jgi:hypothetical protein
VVVVVEVGHEWKCPLLLFPSSFWGFCQLILGPFVANVVEWVEGCSGKSMLLWEDEGLCEKGLVLGDENLEFWMGFVW